MCARAGRETEQTQRERERERGERSDHIFTLQTLIDKYVHQNKDFVLPVSLISKKHSIQSGTKDYT